MPAVGPIPDWDDPDDLRWGLLPFALYRGLASLILGYDPVAERQRKRLAKESRENYERWSGREHEAFDHIHQEHLRRLAEEEAGSPEDPNA